jgi:hypothetical protein
MKNRSIIASIALLTLALPASAETWVRYDVFGSGSYNSMDVSTDPMTWGNGHAKFFGTFFVEIDPMEADDFYSDGSNFSQWDWDDPTKFYNVSAGNGTLSFSYGYNDGDCGHAFCEDAEVNLKFAPGSFNSLPASLPHLISGDISLSQSAHWWSLDAGGKAWSVTSRIVGAPGQSAFSFSTSPAALPEPSSWAAMVAGFGLIGGAMRARRKAAVGFA